MYCLIEDARGILSIEFRNVTPSEHHHHLQYRSSSSSQNVNKNSLTFYRGGCIICIDYSNWSKKPYLDLVQKFDIISHILYEEILELIRRGVDPANGYMFGFSYGGQLASKIGRQLIHYNDYMFKQIDMCDIAGPGFDFLSYATHREAAENVACYYASLDKGTQFRSCHQNILLGHCGYTQPAILSQPYFSSHGLSVQIYINAFDYPFYGSSKLPTWCLAGNPVLNLPEGFKVGYNGDIGSHIQGDIFVPTGLNYPYNLSKRQLKAYEKYFKETNGNLLAKLSPGDESEEAISYVARKCGGNEKTSFIFHGWTESCSTEWVGNLRERNHIQGDIFVPTGLNYPYNLSKRQLKAYEKYFKET
uniref:Uncharacterized protein n=1 Tax=Musca domestica TaxID=7370 RepID=A0A1I8M4U5_MUSDO